MRIAAILFAWILFVSAGNPSTEWKEINVDDAGRLIIKANEWYSNKKEYSVNVTHQTFQSHTAVAPYEKSVGIFGRSNEKYYSNLLGYESIYSLNQTVIIDSTTKIISVTSGKTQFRKPFDTHIIQSVLKACSKLEVADVNDHKTLRLTMPNGEFSVAEIEFDELNRIACLRFFIKDKKVTVANSEVEKISPRMEVRFDNYTNTINPLKDKMEISNYISENNNQLKPVAAYSSYRVNDLRVHN